jgi:plasmid stabilization system protein ParE
MPIAQPEVHMPRGDKSKYTDKQVRQAEHIEAGYEKRGVPKAEAERRAWATENKVSGGGERAGGSGEGKAENHAPMKKGGRIGGASVPKANRVAAGKKAARTRRARAAAKK